MAIDVTRVAFAQREFRIVKNEDLTVQSRHPLASELTYTTFISQQADASSFGSYVLGLLKQDRFNWRLVIRREGHNFAVGETIHVKFPRYGLDAGENFIVKRIRNDFNSPYLDLTIFGPEDTSAPITNTAPTTSPVTLAAIAQDSGPRLITETELLINATDAQSQTLHAINLVISSGLGSLVYNGNFTWTYTPAAGDSSSVSFTYTITDGELTVGGTATMDITVAAGSPPSNITPPTISGSAPTSLTAPGITGVSIYDTIGTQTLSVTSTGTWNNAPTSFQYQWQRNGVDISGATSSSYNLQEADIGSSIRVRVTAVNAYGSSSPAASTTIGPITSKPVKTSNPVITGTPTVGQTLNVTNGTWVGGVTSYAYQWFYDDTTDQTGSTAISGATSNSLVLPVETQGMYVYCRVTATNAVGTTNAPALSNNVGTIAASGGGGGSLSAITLSWPTGHVAGTNPPVWDSSFDNFIAWDSSANSGDKHRLIWRLGGSGAWTTEVYQTLDDELLSGGFTWPLLEAAKPFTAGGLFEAKEQRARYVSNVQTAESAESNTLSDTLDPLAPPEAHRYWRVTLTSVSSGQYATGSELKMSVNGGAGFSDLATGRTYLASDTAFGLGVSRLFDGNTGTEWHSNNTGFPKWVRVDFGSGNAYEINAFRWHMRSTGEWYQCPTAGAVEYSDDGTNWTQWFTYSYPNWNPIGGGNYVEFVKP